MHHFPFHIGDFAKDTARFDLTQVGVYLRLLMEYYDKETPLTDDIELLEFQLGVRTKPEKQALSLVLKLCFKHDAGKKTYVQKRCEEEIADYHRNVLQSRYANVCRHWEKTNPGVPKPSYDAFAKSPDSYFDTDTARVRKVTARNPLVLESHSEDDPSLPLPDSQPITNHQSPVTNVPLIVPKGTVTKKSVSDQALAEAIYLLYPKKVGKGAAIPAILKALKSSGLTELELQGKVREFAAAVETWPEADKPKFIPNPATWFNQKRYMDDPAQWLRGEPDDSQPRFLGQKKEEGGAGKKRAAPEPEWDWKTLHHELWGAFPTARWSELPASTRYDLRIAWDKKNKGGAA